MTPAALKTRTVRDLANLAKKQKVPGWHAMRKDELVKALLKHARSRHSNRAVQERPGNGKV
ncbi:MAG: Rho termination factor N-terminal domain-containing protein, partial [Thermoguttaceae bacterium]